MNSNLQNGISELARASRHRFADARALLREARWQGAMYIAGYAVECLLKTKLMHIYGCRTLTEAGEISNRQRRLRMTQRDVIEPSTHAERLANNKKTFYSAKAQHSFYASIERFASTCARAQSTDAKS